MEPGSEQIVQLLSDRVIALAGSKSSDLERYCWMVVHEHRHGVMPSEYDIRDIDEELFINVLQTASRNNRIED